MKKNFFSLISLFLLLCLCSCNNSNTGTTKQNKDHAVPEVKSVFINGDSIHYIDAGKGEPVVFVHGALVDYRIFHTQMDEFAKSHRVIAYSRRFAYPNKQMITDSAKLSVDSQASDLAELLKALKLGPATLYGHSFGGDIALLTTINHPELVSSLILGESSISVPGGDTIINNYFAKIFVPVVEAFKNNKNEEGVKAFVNGVMGDSLYYNRLSQNYRDIMMANFHEVKGALLVKDNSPMLGCDDVKKIKAPVLLLKGDKSPVSFSLMIEELNRCLSNREMVTLSNTSHGLQFDNPVEFNKIVLAFIDKH